MYRKKTVVAIDCVFNDVGGFMDYFQIKSYFMAKEGVTLSHPYGEKADVFKVEGKKFGVLMSDKEIANVFVKCDPDEALALRDIYHSIVPGYQIDQKHWNSMIVDGRLPESLIKSQIDQSYALVLEQTQVLHYA